MLNRFTERGKNMNENMNPNAGNANDDNIERIRQPKSKTPLIVAVIIALIAIIVLANSIVITKENEYG